MSAHDPQDPHHDAPVPPVTPDRPRAGAAPGACGDADATPSVRDVLASCEAARTVSTPPPADARSHAPADEPAARPASHGRDAA